jgi:hypothetical protein
MSHSEQSPNVEAIASPNGGDDMKLRILSVHGQGDFNEEHVLLEVVQDCDLGAFILADTTYGADGKPSNKVRHTFWFPAKKLKAKDLVSVWTKKGKATVGETTNKKPVHRFFWGLETAVWNDEGDQAVLLELVEIKKARSAAKK